MLVDVTSGVCARRRVKETWNLPHLNYLGVSKENWTDARQATGAHESLGYCYWAIGETECPEESYIHSEYTSISSGDLGKVG